MILIEQLYNTTITIIQFYGLPGYFLAMIIQAIIAPIPSEALIMLGGASFGAFWGGLIGSLGETAGAVFSFYISKKGGRPIVKKLLGSKITDFADKWFQTYGGRAVFLGRLIPVIPFDAVSYGAGLTKIKFKKFFLATLIASFPRAFFFSILGGFVASEISREGFISAFNQILIIVIGLAVTLIVFQNLLVKKVRRFKK
ncbi:MAG: VTT domain-containing protein [Nanoarchaeota archaeon]|nr:VTT domain-containing protein [Nanoarchaeota archaeon]